MKVKQWLENHPLIISVFIPILICSLIILGLIVFPYFKLIQNDYAMQQTLKDKGIEIVTATLNSPDITIQLDKYTFLQKLDELNITQVYHEGFSFYFFIRTDILLIGYKYIV